MSALSRHGLANLAMLFISKAGGVLVVLVFMPMFYRILGAAQFGVVAIILSLQALLVMLDLGMSTMVGREVAVHGTGSPNSAKMWRNAEVVLSVFYLGLLLLAGLWGALSAPANLSGFSTAAIALLFWAMVLQNLGQTVLLGAKSYQAASTLQLFGALLRAAITLIALQQIAATVPVFIAAQLLTTLLQLAFTRWACTRTLTAHLPAGFLIQYDLAGCKALLKQGKPLLIFGLAGAAVMQLDKPIIAAFISAQEVSTYFLAVTFCMTPIGVLAGPVVQYFQPSLIASLNQKNPIYVKALIVQFVSALLAITLLPTILLWVFSDFWLQLWLGDQAVVNQVNQYVKILLPGVALGSIGYIPVVFLTAVKEYKFQARLAAYLAVSILSAVLIAAWMQNIQLVCWAYVSYFVVATIASWAKSLQIDEVSVAARTALRATSRLLLLACFVTFTLYNLRHFQKS